MAALAADLLSTKGFDSEFLDQSGKGGSLGTVLVARRDAARAHAILRRLERGDSADFDTDAPGLGAEFAADFLKAFHGSEAARAGSPWMKLLPVIVIAGVLILVLVGRVVASLIAQSLSSPVG